MKKFKSVNVNKFVEELQILCANNNVKLTLVDSKKIMLSDLACNGYFEGDKNKGKLVVAIKKPLKEWLPILIHESCHLDQWLENKQLFDDLDGIELIDQWLSGKTFKKTEVKKAINESKKLELDCEKRSVNKIIAYDLPIDVNTYIKMANTYVYFYNWVLENRKWTTKNTTLYIKEIYDFAPNTFQKSYKETPRNLNKAFNKHLL